MLRFSSHIPAYKSKTFIYTYIISKKRVKVFCLFSISKPSKNIYKKTILSLAKTETTKAKPNYYETIKLTCLQARKSLKF